MTSLVVERHVTGLLFSTDRRRIDIGFVHRYLSGESYWARGIPLETVERSIENSLCFGVYRDNAQVAFARLVTDYATFAYLADVFVHAPHRGMGISKALMSFIFSIEQLKTLRRIVLATRDAHGLYAKSGFRPLAHPDRFMELHRPDVYKQHD